MSIFRIKSFFRFTLLSLSNTARVLPLIALVLPCIFAGLTDATTASGCLSLSHPPAWLRLNEALLRNGFPGIALTESDTSTLAIT